MENHPSTFAAKKLTLAEIVVIACAFLVPLFFVPMFGFPLQFSKVFIALIIATLLVLAFSAQTLRTGALSFSWSMFSWALVVLPIAYALSALFSSNPLGSLVGYQLDFDTAGFMLLGTVLALVVSFVIKSGRPVFLTLFGLIIAGWVAFLFQFIQIFFGAPFSFLGFDDATSNVVGKWNDFALFAGLIGSVSLLALTTLDPSRIYKVVLWATVGAALIFLAIINFPLAWILIGSIALSVFVYWLTRFFIFHERQKNGIASGLVLLIALFFLVAGSGVSTRLQNILALQTLEVRPSLATTLSVGMAVYEKNLLFGSGPNTFIADWSLYRPAEIIATPFWDARFSAGFGAIPTSLVTGGIVVGMAWVLFAVLFFLTFVRALLTVPAGADRSFFLVVATALSSAYLFFAHIFYVPSQSLTLLLFLCIGLFLASLRGTELTRWIFISFAERPRLGFVSVLAMVVIVSCAFVSVFGTGRLYASTVLHDRVTQTSVPDNIAESAESILRALSLSPQDRYYQTLAVIEVLRLRQIIGSGKIDEEVQEEFYNTFTRAVDAAAKAVSINRGNAANFMTLGGVYQEIVPLEVPGAYESASAAYEEARLLDPANPEIDFHIAEMKTIVGDTAGARVAVEAALKKKTDYTPAILLLAQVSLDEGKLTDAISAVEAVVYLNPNNELMVYQLGLLYFEDKIYQKAADAFTQALDLNPEYANASFFLGESYVFLEKKDDALKIFHDLETRNPGNVTLTAIIAGLEKEINPFTAENIPLPPEPSITE